MQVVILAGGKGTRMGDRTRHVPKPMVPLAGRPILEHQIDLARRYGAEEVLLLTGHLGEVIERHFGDGRDFGVPIRHYRESVPLGTAGALKEIEDSLADDFLVFYGDTIMDVDLDALARFHRENGSSATLVVHPNDHPHDSDLLALAPDRRIMAFHPKPHPADSCLGNCANAALYAMSRTLLKQVERGRCADLGREVFPKAVASGHAIFGYPTAEYIKDIGTPERLREVEQDVLSGKVARLNRSYPRPAIFLDRDGVVNVERDHILKPDDLELLPGVAEAVRKINRSEYLAVLVTNQPAVAKGWLTEDELRRIHGKLETLLGIEGAYLDRLYYCPHHPEKGFKGENPEYKIPCNCRKPAPGMLLTARDEMNIDLAQSWMIGDRTIDIAAGARAGCRTILVETGYGGRDGRCDVPPDLPCQDLCEAADRILRRYSSPSACRENRQIAVPSFVGKGRR
jgi:D,D-heptose 1,7-bisphosphate phosphatase